MNRATFGRKWLFLVKNFFDDDSDENDDRNQNDPYNDKFHELSFLAKPDPEGNSFSIFKNFPETIRLFLNLRAY